MLGKILQLSIFASAGMGNSNHMYCIPHVPSVCTDTKRRQTNINHTFHFPQMLSAILQHKRAAEFSFHCCGQALQAAVAASSERSMRYTHQPVYRRRGVADVCGCCLSVTGKSCGRFILWCWHPLFWESARFYQTMNSLYLDSLSSFPWV